MADGQRPRVKSQESRAEERGPRIEGRGRGPRIEGRGPCPTVLGSRSSAIDHWPRALILIDPSSPIRHRPFGHRPSAIPSSVHLPGLDVARGELVELDVLEVAEELAVVLELAGVADRLDAAVVQDDDLLAR